MCELGEHEESSTDAEDKEQKFLEFVEHHCSVMVLEFFLEDEELAKIALCCRVSLDLLCKEMHTAMGAAGPSGKANQPSRYRGSTDSSAREHCRYSTKQNRQYLSKAHRRLQSWTRRWGRAELRAKSWDVVLRAAQFARQEYLCLLKRKR